MIYLAYDDRPPRHLIIGFADSRLSVASALDVLATGGCFVLLQFPPVGAEGFFMRRVRGSAIRYSVLQLVVLAVLAGFVWVFLPALRGMVLCAVLVLTAAFCVIMAFHHAPVDPLAEWPVDGLPHGTSAPPGCRPRPPAGSKPPGDLRSLDWFQFERVVAELFVQEGETVQRLGGANPDGGIDLVLLRPSGQLAVQCKHWKAWKTGVKQIREFVGAMKDHGATQGVFVCLNECSPEAQALAARQHIEIVTETSLRRRLEAVNWLSRPSFAAILDDRRKVCPKCEADMVLRIARRGAGAGQSFWGCSTYPRCRFTMPAQQAA